MKSPIVKGKYRWVAEKKDGELISKYDSAGNKKPYHYHEQTLDRKDIKTWGFTDDTGKAVAVLDVPSGAVVFQRRRVENINYRGKWYTETNVIPPQRVAGGMLPERTIVKKVPELYYDQVWLIGWRKREADNTVTVRYKAVYPDGVVEEYTAWNVKPWLREPEWFAEEEV